MGLEDKTKDKAIVSTIKNTLKDAKLIVLKVGSAVLTNGDKGLDLRVINRLVDQISNIHDMGKKVILVSSGAVATGATYLKYSLKGKLPLEKKQAAAAVGQSRLMHIYDEAFEKYNKITAQILLTKDDLKSRQRFLNARNTFSTLLSEGVVPIVNENDTVVVEELKFGDNDYLATLILNLVGADLFINLTSAKGVYTSNPDQDKNAKPIHFIDDIMSLDIESMCTGKTLSGTGGMYSKLLAAKRAAQLGVPTLIVSGKIPFVLEKVFSGEIHGTWIQPCKNIVPRRKFWLAYNLEPKGTIVVDLGAKNALLFKGKSLLPAGIVRVLGNFEENSLVKILSEDGAEIGVGLCNYSSEELKIIGGKNTRDVPELITRDPCPEEVVHRDNLLIDAVF